MPITLTENLEKNRDFKWDRWDHLGCAEKCIFCFVTKVGGGRANQHAGPSLKKVVGEMPPSTPRIIARATALSAIRGTHISLLICPCVGVRGTFICAGEMQKFLRAKKGDSLTSNGPLSPRQLSAVQWSMRGGDNKI